VVAERLLAYITAEHLVPGDRLPTEKGLAERLQVSKTLVREAVKILSAVGRLTVQKGRGIYVGEPLPGLWLDSHFTPTDPEQIYSLFEFRGCIERSAARLAADRATPAQVKAIGEAVRRCHDAAASGDTDAFAEADVLFHRSLALAAGNEYLASSLDWIQRLHRQITVISLSGVAAGSLSVAAQQHEGIADAIASSDGDRASTGMDEHLQVTLSQVQQKIRERIFAE
jgi:DNA-binding FadR family transcriptional regulator